MTTTTNRLCDGDVSPRDAALTLNPNHWRTMAASARGASHFLSGAPNQDAYRFDRLQALGADAVLVAIADGHGDQRHFRSERGSRFAVDSACTCTIDAAPQLIDSPSSTELKRTAVSDLVPAIVMHWREMVRSDVAANPFTEEQCVQLQQLDGDPELAYGSTLLVATMWRNILLLLQIGDGDAVVLEPGGGVQSPVPGDSRLDGRRTTSLCQIDAASAFRVAVVDRSNVDIAGVLLATDGFGNAQVAEPWEPAVGGDVVKMLRDRGPSWIEQQLPFWVEECASSGGSADDTTVALVLTTGLTAVEAPAATVQMQRDPEPAPTVLLRDRQRARQGHAAEGHRHGPDAATTHRGAQPTPVAGEPAPEASRHSHGTWIRLAIALVIALTVGAVVFLTTSGPRNSQHTHRLNPVARPPTTTGTGPPSQHGTKAVDGHSPTTNPVTTPAQQGQAPAASPELAPQSGASRAGQSAESIGQIALHPGSMPSSVPMSAAEILATSGEVGITIFAATDATQDHELLRNQS